MLLINMNNPKESAVADIFPEIESIEDLTRTEVYNYLYTNKIDPVDLLTDLLNGYEQTHLIFDEIRS